MWLFLSRRFRTWLVLALALAVARLLLRRATAFAARRSPRTPAASVLGHVDALSASSQPAAPGVAAAAEPRT